MNLYPSDIIPITQARNKLGNLVQKVSGDNYIVLTKGGSPKAALVGIDYLTKLQKEIKKIFSQTFIDPMLVKYTRVFTDKEIKQWQKEDTLR